MDKTLHIYFARSLYIYIYILYIHLYIYIYIYIDYIIVHKLSNEVPAY